MSAELCFAEKITLLEIPLEKNNEKIIYTIEKKGQCEFNTEKKVMVTGEVKEGDEKLDFFEKIYFDISNPIVLKKQVSFQISAASNVKFFFIFENCKLKKSIEISDEIIIFEKIEVYYKNNLGAPVLHKLRLIYKNSWRDIYPYTLEGHIPIYELKVGTALSIRNNLRPNNQKTFLKNDPILEPIPVFLFRYGTFFINKDGAGTALFAYDDFSLMGVGLYDGEPYRHPELKERKKGIFLGPLLRWKNLDIKYMRDWIDNKRGEELKVSFSYGFRPGLNTEIIPRIYAQYWNETYTNYYAGVGVNESTSSFSFYRPKKALNWSLMFRSFYHYKKLSYVADFGIKFLDREVYNSPIILKKYELRLTLGVLYKVF